MFYLQITRKNTLQLDFYIELFLKNEIDKPTTYLVIKNKNVISNEIVSLTLLTGLQTRIAISRTNDIKLTDPYNKCKIMRSIDGYHTDLYEKTYNEFNDPSVYKYCISCCNIQIAFDNYTTKNNHIEFTYLSCFIFTFIFF